MQLANLPPEILRTIFRLLIINATSKQAIYYLRQELNQATALFARFVESEYSVLSGRWTQINTSSHDRQWPSEKALHADIRQELLMSRTHRSCLTVLCSQVRLSIALLVAIAEMKFADILDETAVVSDGYLEDHTDDASRLRFTRLVDLMVSTIIASVGWRHWAEVLNDSRFPSPLVYCSFSALEWATAAAVYAENFEVTQKLLSEYAKIGARSSDFPGSQYSGMLGESAMFFHPVELCRIMGLAIRKCSFEMAEFVIQHEACVGWSFGDLPCPTHLESACERGSLRLVDIVLDRHGGVLDGTCRYSRAIALAARCPCSRGESSQCEERVAIIGKLLSLAATTSLSNMRQIALREASTWGCCRIVSLMLDTGADADLIDGCGKASLTYAAVHGHTQLMEVLLTRGSRPASLFFLPNRCRFIPEAANVDMLEALPELHHGNPRPSLHDQRMARFILLAAARLDCGRVIELLIWAGFDLCSNRCGIEALETALACGSPASSEVLKRWITVDHQGPQPALV